MLWLFGCGGLFLGYFVLISLCGSFVVWALWLLVGLVLIRSGFGFEFWVVCSGWC